MEWLVGQRLRIDGLGQQHMGATGLARLQQLLKQGIADEGQARFAPADGGRSGH